MKKGSVFAGKKGSLAAGFGTPVNMSSASSSFFDSSLQQMPHLLPGPPRNWQATPLKSHRLPPHHYQQQPNSASSIRAHPTAMANTPNTSLINRAKPYSLQGLVENLNEVSNRSTETHRAVSLSLSSSYLQNWVSRIACATKRSTASKTFSPFSML